jgi:hypothetical protein
MKEHIGDACPVAPDETVRFDLGDGRIYVEQARSIYWGPGAGPNGEGRVLRYEVLNRVCACPLGSKCVASDGGRALGRMSVISDIRCRAVGAAGGGNGARRSLTVDEFNRGLTGGRVSATELPDEGGVCGCAPGACAATPCGKARGVISMSSDLRCKATIPAACTSATELLNEASSTMQERAREYDQPGGERNMAATVAAFNALTGHRLQESEGWLFMEVLKARRDFSTPHGHEDSQRDRIAYAALGAEARRAGR